MRSHELVEFYHFQMRRNEAAAKSIEDDPIVNDLRMSQEHSAVEDNNLIMSRWLKSEILLRQREHFRIQFGRSQGRVRKGFLEELIKSSAAEADHQHIFGMRMKN